MLIKTRGIVFRAIKYSESSLIVDIYTEAKGLQKYIVRGVRSKKAKIKASLLQVMSLVDLVGYFREDRELHHIREIRPAYVYQSLPFELRKGAVGLFMAEVARKAIRQSEEHQALFGFLFHYFCALDRSEQSFANYHLHFALHLTTFLGFMPVGGYDPATPYFDLKEGQFIPETPDHPFHLPPELSHPMSHLLENRLEHCHQVRLTASQRRELLGHLLDYYRLHIENFPEIHAHRILQEVLG